MAGVKGEIDRFFKVFGEGGGQSFFLFVFVFSERKGSSIGLGYGQNMQEKLRGCSGYAHWRWRGGEHTGPF